MEGEYVVELSLSTLVWPCCTSRLLWRCGRVSGFSIPAARVPSQAGAKGISIFSPVTLVRTNYHIVSATKLWYFPIYSDREVRANSVNSETSEPDLHSLPFHHFLLYASHG